MLDMPCKWCYTPRNSHSSDDVRVNVSGWFHKGRVNAMRKQQPQIQQPALQLVTPTTVGLFEELARVQRTLDTVRENGANLMRSVNESAERHGWGASSVIRGLDLIEDLQREEARLIERRRQLRVAAALVAARAS